MKKDLPFSDYARYYDLLYKDKDYAAEVEYLKRLSSRWCPSVNSVLELGSGTGRHATCMTDLGYSVHGIERSKEMLDRAGALTEARLRNDATWRPPRFSQGDIRAVRVGLTFDMVVSLFHVISYQTTNDDVLSALKTARIHLSEGGLFVFDVWYGPAVLTERPSVRVKRMGDNNAEVTRLCEPLHCPNDDIVEVGYHVYIRNKVNGMIMETTETHYMRYFFMPELRLFAAATGFKIQHTEEWMTGRTLGCDTWGACIVLRAI